MTDRSEPVDAQNFLKLTLGGAIAHLRLSRPETANAIDPTGHTELVHALRRVANDFDGKVLVISAEARIFRLAAISRPWRTRTRPSTFAGTCPPRRPSFSAR